jgi:hypothetical protein
MLLSLVALASLGAMPATAQVNYAVSGGTAYVTSSPNASGDVVIASTYNGYPVTGIGNSAFFFCTNLTNVTISDSVTNIGVTAFYLCTNLTNVTMGSSVTAIRDGAFAYCTSLRSVTIPNGVASIGPVAFSFCTSLTNLTVEAANPVYSSVNGVLFNKAQTTLITFPPGRGGDYVIPNSVTTIENSAFSRCTNLTSVTLPDSVTSIGKEAFFSCASLTNVALGSSVTAIADGAFYYCTKLMSVTVPDSVTTIGNTAFYYCTNLTNVTLGSVATIGINAFSFCTSLANVALGSSVTNIGIYAFNYCASLTSFSVDAGNSVYSSLDGVLFNETQTTLITFPAGRGGNYFIPNSVTTIGEAAFFSCTSLMSVTIPNSVTTLEQGTFSLCTSLANVTLGSSVTNIANYAFSRCTNLTSVTIPSSVTTIGVLAFLQCTSLTNFSVDAANSVYSTLDGVLFNRTQTTLIQFPGGRGGSYVVPNSVTNIGNYAFYGRINLTSVTIPDGVANIGVSAFSLCTHLTKFTFLGNAPFFGGYFESVGVGATVYYYYGTTGWGQLYGDLPTVMLGAPAPQVATGSPGVKPGGFGFTVGGVVNQTIVIEASTNLTTWQPVWTNLLSARLVNFVDPEWQNYPRRFYRARSN